MRSIPLEQFQKRRLKRGDLLLEKSGGGENQPVGFVVLFEHDFDAVCSNFVARMTPSERALPTYLSYLHSALYRIRVNVGHIKQNTGIQNLDSNSYLSERVALPPLPEQAAIAAFLDRETAKIAALIAKQERMIALLGEKRQALIAHAVTKGLRADAPMKDSGVAWLGEIPAHWDVKRIASISTKITNGYVGPTRDILVEQGITYLQSLHIKNNRIIFDVKYFVTPEWSNQHDKSILKVGDTLIVQTGDIGQVAVVDEHHAGANCHALIIVSPVTHSIVGRYLALVLNSDYGFHSLKSIQTGALHPHLNCTNVRDIYVPVPPLGEQEEILQYINTETTKIDALIAKAQQAIALMREHRTSLIAAAVTGKIDVRGEVVGAAAGGEAGAEAGRLAGVAR